MWVPYNECWLISGRYVEDSEVSDSCPDHSQQTPVLPFIDNLNDSESSQIYEPQYTINQPVQDNRIDDLENETLKPESGSSQTYEPQCTINQPMQDNENDNLKHETLNPDDIIAPITDDETVETPLFDTEDQDEFSAPDINIAGLFSQGSQESTDENIEDPLKLCIADETITNTDVSITTHHTNNTDEVKTDECISNQDYLLDYSGIDGDNEWDSPLPKKIKSKAGKRGKVKSSVNIAKQVNDDAQRDSPILKCEELPPCKVSGVKRKKDSGNYVSDAEEAKKPREECLAQSTSANYESDEDIFAEDDPWDSQMFQSQRPSRFSIDVTLLYFYIHN